MKKLTFLQAFRGIAALMIVILHSRINYPLNESNLISNWLFNSAGSGVDLFFVISGFIMVYTTRNSDGTFLYTTQFAIKRIVRIVPVYFIVTIIFFIVMHVAYKLVGADYNFVLQDVLKSFMFIPLDLNNASPPFFGAPVLHVGWSLNYEMYFYFIIFISLLFKRFRWILFSAWIAFSLLALPYIFGNSVTITGFQDYNFDGYLNIVTSPLIWEFVAGVIIGLLYFTPLRIPNPVVARYIAWVSVAFTIWWIVSGIHGGVGITHWGLPMVIMVLCFVIASKTYDFIVPKWLIWLGDISFSLYLVHPIVTDTTSVLLWGTPARTAIQDPSFIPLMIAISIGLAALSHRYLEKALSNKIRDIILINIYTIFKR